MAIKSQRRLYSQQRLTTSTWRAVESAVSFDFDTVLRKMFTGDTTGYILSGFRINIGSSSFSTDASNLTLYSLNSTILHTLADESGTILNVEGSTAESLNSTNSKVVGGFAANSTNYVGIELVRVTDEDSTETTYFWDADAEAEFSRVLPSSTVLDYRIVITQSGFGNLLPIATVITNASNVPTTITDCRNLLFRLGTGGTSPNPNYSYPWSAGRTEPGTSTTSTSVDPFQGGDKQITTFRDWIEAIETSIKEIKGTAYWFESGSGGGSAGNLSLFSVAEDANFSYLTGEGTISHNIATTGLLQWTNDLFIRNVFSSAYYKIQSNATGITISNGSVLALSLTRYQTLASNITFAPSLATVPAAVQAAASSVTTRILSGNAGDFSVLTANSSTTDQGDFIKVFGDSPRFYSQISEFYGVAGAVTSSANAKYAVLTSAYGGSIGVQTLQYNKTYYPTSSLIVTSSSNVLANTTLGNLRWIASRNDLTNRSVIYLREYGELQQGEIRQINDNTSDNVLLYVGAVTGGTTNESLSTPIYSATATTGVITSPSQTNYSGTSTDNLTDRVSRLSTAVANKAQDKNISFAGGGTVSNVSGLITWNSSATFMIGGPGSGTVNWIASGSANLTANYSCAYVTIDRNNITAVPVSVTTIALLPLAENIVVFARKFDSNSVYLGIDGQTYLVNDGTNSSSGFSPASFASFGISTLHKWTQEIPAGSINSVNTTYSISFGPFSNSAFLLFKNGLYQSQGSSLTSDYNINGNIITFNSPPLTGDELVCTYAQGGTVPYTYVQGTQVLSSVTTVINLSSVMSNTASPAVFLNGLQRSANTDFTASAATINFAFSLTTSDQVGFFYADVNDNIFSVQRYFRENASNTRSIYTTFVDTGFSDNSLLFSVDGVQQFPINNSYGVNTTNITVVDYRRINPQVFELNPSSLTSGSLLYLWSR